MNARYRAAVAAALLLGSAASAQSLTAADFAALPAMEDPMLSPDGESIAFITHTPTGSGVLVARLEGLSITHFIDTSRTKPRAVTWVSDDAIIYVTSRTVGLPFMTGGFEAATPFGKDLSRSSDPIPLLQEQARTTMQGGGARRVGGIYAINGAQFIGLEPSTGRVLMPKYADNADRVLYAVDPKTDRQTEVDEGTPNTVDWIVDETGEPLFRVEHADRQDRFRILERTSGLWEVMVSETVEIPEMDVFGLNDAGELIVGARPGGVGRFGLYVMEVPSGEIGRAVLADPLRDVSGVKMDPYTNRVVGAVVGAEATVWFDDGLARQQELLEEAFPEESPYIVSWSQDRTKFIVRTESASVAPAYYIYDSDALTAGLVASAYPGTDGHPLPPREPFSYDARDGASIPGFLTRPQNSGASAPLVVLPHGGPESYDISGFDWLAQFIASRGYVVLQPNFRGSTGYGSDWRDAGRGQWGTGVMQTDLSDGVTALIEQGIADPDRVCIVGASYGGYAALAGATFTPELYACAAAIAPVSDLTDMIAYERERRGSSSWALQYWRTVIGGELGAARDRLAAISPARHVDNVRAPILLIHGRDDSVVPIDQSREMEDALKDAGKSVELIELDGEDHWLSRPETRLETLEALERFLAEHLEG